MMQDKLMKFLTGIIVGLLIGLIFLMFSAAVIEVNGKIVGFGCLEAILEAVMIIDLDRPVIERFETLRQLVDAAKWIVKDRGFERFYMFPSDSSFKDILVNRLGMDTCSEILTCEVPNSADVKDDEVSKDGK